MEGLAGYAEHSSRSGAACRFHATLHRRRGYRYRRRVPGLIENVLRGHVGLLEAAESVRRRVRLVKAYREADRDDRKALGKMVGIDRVFDEAIAPLL